MTNKHIKELNSLRDKSKARKEAGLFIVEGLKMFAEAPAENLLEVYVTSSFAKEHADIIAAKQREWERTLGKQFAGKQYEVIEESLMSKLSDTKTPQGVLCVLKQPGHTLEDIIESATTKSATTKSATEKGTANSLFVVLEDIQDPGNLGTIIRTGEGAGVAGVIMSKGCVDIFNPKTIRSTMGSIYRVPFAYVEDIAQAIKTMQKVGIRVYAAHLKGERYYNEVNYCGQENGTGKPMCDREAAGRTTATGTAATGTAAAGTAAASTAAIGTAFLIGNEGNGLKDETAALADEYIKIPMEGSVESLNAAVATSILMYEHHRQNM